MSAEVTPETTTPETTPEAPSAGAVLKEVSSPPPPEGAWYKDLPEDDRAFLTVKGWDKEGKGPADVLKSYRSLEKMKVDPDRVMPDPTDAEAVKAFKEKLGIPSDESGYEMPATDFMGAPLDAAPFQKLSRSLELTKDQHARFVEGTNALLVEFAEQAAIQKNLKDTAEKVELEAAWAGTKDENYAAAARAATRFGIDDEALERIQEGLGYKGTIELFTKIGRAFGEGKPPEPARGTGDPFGLTPAAAKEQMAALRGDAEFRNKLLNGDTTAKGKWESLKKIAFSG